MPEVKSRTYANPRRLPRRNHYQEGLGFLFVATQGGRPPDGLVDGTSARTVRRRRTALRRWAGGESVAQICTELSCSRASELPPAVERLILTVRLLTYWNSRRIAAEFRRRGVWPLSHG